MQHPTPGSWPRRRTEQRTRRVRTSPGFSRDSNHRSTRRKATPAAVPRSDAGTTGSSCAKRQPRRDCKDFRPCHTPCHYGVLALWPPTLPAWTSAPPSQRRTAALAVAVWALRACREPRHRSSVARRVPVPGVSPSAAFSLLTRSVHSVERLGPTPMAPPGPMGSTVNCSEFSEVMS